MVFLPTQTQNNVLEITEMLQPREIPDARSVLIRCSSKEKEKCDLIIDSYSHAIAADQCYSLIDAYKAPPNKYASFDSGCFEHLIRKYNRLFPEQDGEPSGRPQR